MPKKKAEELANEMEIKLKLIEGLDPNDELFLGAIAKLLDKRLGNKIDE